MVEIPANYNFAYRVADAVSGDSKTQEETMDNGVVKGSYSVADPDGRVRVVTYTADEENGFRATVTYDGEPGPVAIPFDPPVAATVARPALHAAPAFVQHALPAAAHPTFVRAHPAGFGSFPVAHTALPATTVVHHS